jgi:hypothetical protein
MLIEQSNPNEILKFLKIAIACFFIIIVCRRIPMPLKIFKQPSLFIISAPYDIVETKALKSDFDYSIPVTEDRCFYSDIPCVPFPLDNVKLRGENLQNGFKIIK